MPRGPGAQPVASMRAAAQGKARISGPWTAEWGSTPQPAGGAKPLSPWPFPRARQMAASPRGTPAPPRALQGLARPLPTQQPPDGGRSSRSWRPRCRPPTGRTGSCGQRRLKFDTNRDGCISLGELRAALKALLGERLSQREVDEIFRDIDLNGDGLVDFEGNHHENPGGKNSYPHKQEKKVGS
ncbi:calcium-binding protein 2 isoform X5 [Phocoena sinus]|uniref:calcium-binding protein 2 isoform X5 n=1 Tax=Phocoena sinus TaxID=42100 RepID=UPI0013C47DA1|nr:calcium-binding protein 2 isoform X5 [Phocoena sinus]